VADLASPLVRKLWQFCTVLRDDGLSYPDYVEQLTYLLFLKMAAEADGGLVPAKLSWRSIVRQDADGMRRQYERVLSELGRSPGTLGLIFRDGRNKISDPAKLRLLVELIADTEWSALSADVKGDAYEGLLEKNARDTKSGAGQYFTPRPLVEAIVECVAPRLGEVISDPACGTGGFLLAANRYLRDSRPTMTSAERDRLRRDTFRGVELVPEVARLAGMNLFLHGIASETDDPPAVRCADSLHDSPTERVDIVLTNPPFGTKGTVTTRRRQHEMVDSSTI
jgi:type I restriction enzyme M protein